MSKLPFEQWLVFLATKMLAWAVSVQVIQFILPVGLVEKGVT